MKPEFRIAIAAESAEGVVDTLSRELGIAFTGHDSSYKGEYWQCRDEGGCVIEVSHNDDPMYLPEDPPEEAYFEPRFADFAVLLWTDVAEAMQSRLWAAVQRHYPGSEKIVAPNPTGNSDATPPGR